MSENLVQMSAREKTLEEIRTMKSDNIREAQNCAIVDIRKDAMVYIVKYLRNTHRLKCGQIMSLRSDALNEITQTILNRHRRYILVGLIPIYGWWKLAEYLRFRMKIRFLKRVGINKLFDYKNLIDGNMILYSYPASDSPF